MSNIPEEIHLNIGAIIFPRLDQTDFTAEPPFNSGTPATAPPEILEAARSTSREITEARLTTAKRIAARLGVVTKESRL